jgi:hypothetical protein
MIAFNANIIERRAYEVSKQFQDLKIDVTLFSETHLKPHMRSYISNCDIYQTDHHDEHRGGSAVEVRKGIPHT